MRDGLNKYHAFLCILVYLYITSLVENCKNIFRRLGCLMGTFFSGDFIIEIIARCYL